MGNPPWRGAGGEHVSPAHTAEKARSVVNEMSRGNVSPLSSEALVLKALTILADHLEQAANEIKELFVAFEPLEYGANLVGRIFQVENRVEFIPAESLQIRANDPAITNFLSPRILEKSKEKHGWNYRVFEKDGVLDRIVIYGDLKSKDIEDLKGPFGWTFQKAAERAKKKKEETKR